MTFVLFLACMDYSITPGEQIVDNPYRDYDGDGFTIDDGDCNDQEASIYPGAPELCDALDNDCNEVIDDGLAVSGWLDSDADGFGDPASERSDCSDEGTYVDNSDDCDDSDPFVNPYALEDCNGLDDDCDDGIDEGLVVEGYLDEDGDGFGVGQEAELCIDVGVAQVDGDCDDSLEAVNPEAEEICDNGLDDDCDGRGCGVDAVRDTDAAAVHVETLSAPAGSGERVLLYDTDQDGLAEPILAARGFSDSQGRVTTYLDPDLRGGDLGLATNYDAPVNLGGLGSALAVGDPDADGDLEIAIGSKRWDNDGRGAVYVMDYDLQTGGRLLEGTQSWGSLGASALVADLDDDGYDDLISGAESQDTAVADDGAVYVAWGPVTATTSTAALDRMVGPTSYCTFGAALLADDLTGDGDVDLVVASPGYESYTADAKIYRYDFGTELVGEGAAQASMTYSGADALGFDLDSGDIDGDGRADLVVGASGSDVVWIFTDPESTEASHELTGEANFGATTAVGDLDGNGWADVIVNGGSTAYGAGDMSDPYGSVVVFLGPIEGTLDQADALVIDGTESGMQFGTWLSTGDVDGDGLDDLWVGAPGYTVGAGGKSYLFAGSGI